MFGSVPWNNSYTDVRLYGSLDEQYTDISSLMRINTSNYSYVARERRLKVSVEADRLYHCNYCMYRNESLTQGWIYCFISNVTYVNDNTTEITLETDVFQTYLNGVDWIVPPCFIERMTVGDDSEEYMFTSEPDFPLTYKYVDRETRKFGVGGWAIFTSEYPQQNSGLDAVLNPGGYYGEPVGVHIYKGIIQGCCAYIIDAYTLGGGYVSEELETLLNGLQWAGSVESIVAITTLPDFDTIEGLDQGWLGNDVTSATGNDFERYQSQEGIAVSQAHFDAPSAGDSIDGYVPHNRKLYGYPYNYLELDDYNGSHVELRFELMKNSDGEYDPTIRIKYIITPGCEALVYPNNYSGIPHAINFGFVTKCGAQGSWANDLSQTWWAQNGTSVTLSAIDQSIGAAVGTTAIAAGVGMLTGGIGMAAIGAGAGMVASSAGQTANTIGELSRVHHQPSSTHGQAGSDLLFGSGVQGIYATRVCVTAEIAERIDQFFDVFGYAVEKVMAPDLTSRPSWNYVKTSSCAPKSTNSAAGSSSPFYRGTGTPAEALTAIKNSFDNGITFWHTTAGFGDYSLDNTL